MDRSPDNKTILLVEDEALLALSTARLLRKQGYQVITAFHGEEALQVVRAHPEINLVLMDIDLGEGMDGTEVAQHILQERHVPVIFLSGHTEPDVVARTEKISSYGYVVKGSGAHVLDASIHMAFKLYEASRLLNEREAHLEIVLAEQRDTLRALQEKTLELETFFENAIDLLCLADNNGYFHRVNREWERLLGYDTRELNGRRFLDFVHPDDLPATLAAMGKLSEQEPVIDFVNRYRCRDGSYRWIEWRSKPYGDLVLATASDISERVIAEQQLKKNQVLLKDMGEMARVGGWEIDLTTMTLTWTQQVYYLHEVAPDYTPELRSAIGFYTPATQPVISAAVQRAIDLGEPFDLELQLISAKGNWLWVHAMGRVEFESGRARAVLGTIQDITERKQLENTQQFMAKCGSRGKEFFEALALFLAEQMHMDYVCIDRLEPDGFAARTVAIYTDGHFEDNVTYSLGDTPCGQVVGKMVCCFPRDVRHIFPRDALLQEMSAESYVGATLWDTQGRPIGLIAVIGRSPLAHPPHAESILQLVAIRAAAELERKQAEDALRASEERYRTLVEISPDPISLTDLEGKFITVNQAGLHQLGYDSLEALQNSNETSFSVIAEVDRPRALENAYKTFELGSVRNIEYQIRTRDGQIVATEISASVIRDSEGQPTAFIGISHDIQERKLAEAAQARALQEKSILLRDLQHRIKNSLTLIGSLISLEQEKAAHEETYKALGEVHDRVGSLAGLYNILYESNTLQQVWLELYLQQVAQSLADTYLRTHQRVKLELSCDPVLIDSRQATPFGLILNELLTNALKYAFPGNRTGTIWVSLRKLEEQVVLQVADDGVGLPASFTGAEIPPGLGLQIVALLVHQLHGSMLNQQGERTIFTVQVPYNEVAILQK